MPYKVKDLIIIHNNIARRKGIKQIRVGTRMTFDQIADRIEAVNKYRQRGEQNAFTKMSMWLWSISRRAA